MIGATEAALIVSGIALIEATVALLVVLLRHPKPTDTAVEGMHGLDNALTAGCDLPTAPLPRAGRGTVYAGSHRRTGPSERLANLGWPHIRRIEQTQRDLP